MRFSALRLTATRLDGHTLLGGGVPTADDGGEGSESGHFSDPFLYAPALPSAPIRRAQVPYGQVGVEAGDATTVNDPTASGSVVGSR